jgi:mercuric ion transport protein
MNTPKEKGWLLGLVAAVAASLCCITPVLALISGVGGIASTFSWIEPARPYLISATVLVLGFAWYQKLKPRTPEEIACACETDEKPSFWQSKKFLGIVTVLAVALMAFPNYAHIFYPKPKQIIVNQEATIQQARFVVSGMTCTGCEEHVKHALSEVNGVIESEASYEAGTASVKYDAAKTSINALKEAINATGYTVEDIRADDAIPVFQMASGNTIELTVKGMTCSGCEAHVVHALDEVEGVLQASASYKNAKATITFDPAKTTVEKIKAAINGTGYKVVEQESTNN